MRDHLMALLTVLLIIGMGLSSVGIAVGVPWLLAALAAKLN